MTEQPAAPKPKMALCIERSRAPDAFNNHLGAPRVFYSTPGFWYTPTRLVDRAVCETDESTLQLIPYVMLASNRDVVTGAVRFFTYVRGKAGEEGRLHDKLSIGLGGHVDEEVPAGVSLREWLAQEAARELREEVSLAVAWRDVAFADAIICDPSDGVGRVHLGVLSVVRADPSDLGRAEAGVIEGSRWLTLEELRRHDVFDNLEGWSQAAVRHMSGPDA